VTPRAALVRDAPGRQPALAALMALLWMQNITNAAATLALR
jgi:hypothetical protein